MRNQIKTVLLLGLLTGLMLGIGQLLGGINGITIALIFALIMNFGSWFFADKIVLKIYRAKEVSKDSKLYKLVKEIIAKTKLPMPKVYLVPSQNPNAFATGRSPKKSAVACTEGLMNILNDEELKGVIAHEISHIKNRDTLIATIAATIAGVISYIAYMARWSAIFGNDREGGLELILMAILTPIIATIIQLAISRSREYMADRSGAVIMKNGKHLADALEKIEQASKNRPMKIGTKSTAAIFIYNPFKMGLFRTHPKTNERVRLLRAMKFHSH